MSRTGSRSEFLLDKLISGVITKEIVPETLRSEITRKQVSEYLGISLIEAGQVKAELTLLVAKARLGALSHNT